MSESNRVTLPELTRRVVEVEEDIKKFPEKYVSKDTFRALEKVFYLFAGAMLTGLFGLLMQAAIRGFK